MRSTQADAPRRISTRSATGADSARTRLGIIGCGAITENAHLRAVLSSPLVELTALSDTNEARLRYLQRQFDLRCIGFPDYRDTFAHVDAVVLALPNYLHASVGCEFLSRGIHALCEKPLATSLSECERLCQIARSSRAVLAVGYVTRFYPSTALTKQLIDEGLLGPLTSFDYEFGTEGGWAPVSGYNLARRTAGGGVLVVSGSHFLDRMLYLFGDVEVIRYADDSRGGVEANCVAQFQARIDDRSVLGRVTLSKTHRLSNRLRIVGHKGALEVAEGESRRVTFVPAGRGFRHEIFPEDPVTDDDHFRAQLEDFVRSIRTGTMPRVTGEQGSASVAIIERCYRIAEPLAEPWVDATLPRVVAAPSGDSSAATRSAAPTRAMGVAGPV